MTAQLDILIGIIPKINPDAPTVGPAVLKSHIEAHGMTCEVVDFNVKLFNAAKQHNLQNYYFEDDYIFALEHDHPELHPDFVKFYNTLEYVFLDWIEFIKQKNPRIIGMSLLSAHSVAVAAKLGVLLKIHCPHIRILWGGAAIEYGIHVFQELGYCDDYIYGDGEASIIDYLKGNFTGKGINSLDPNQVTDLNSVMIPNYDDIDWSEYQNEGHPHPVYITGSRGCVKRCTFCNVYRIWPDYYFRDGEYIAQEIIEIKEKYDRKTFLFTDSLINGSMKAFRNLMKSLINYRQTNSDFSWVSQWIIRPKHQSPEEDYQSMKASGCSMLEIGLESFSQDIRYHMGKKFTDDDMWHCLAMLNNYDIPHVLLMIVGYPTETEADHQHTLACIRHIFKLGWQKNTRFSFGNTLMLHRSQPLFPLIEDELEYYHSNIDWKYRDNDLNTRIRRIKEVNSLIKELQNIDVQSWLTEKALKNYDKKLEGSLPNDSWLG